MARQEILELLTGGDRRSLGRSGEVVRMVSERPEAFADLTEFLWHSDPVVRMRAADAMEKASLTDPALLQPFKPELLGLLDEAVQQELRWHLAAMITRLKLTVAERRRAVVALRTYLDDRSSIVKTLAMQGLADLAKQDASLVPEVREQIQVFTKAGTPAMRARGRKLLSEMD
jgi:hypothetical protein